MGVQSGRAASGLLLVEASFTPTCPSCLPPTHPGRSVLFSRSHRSTVGGRSLTALGGGGGYYQVRALRAMGAGA